MKRCPRRRARWKRAEGVAATFANSQPDDKILAAMRKDAGMLGEPRGVKIPVIFPGRRKLAEIGLHSFADCGKLSTSYEMRRKQI